MRHVSMFSNIGDYKGILNIRKRFLIHPPASDSFVIWKPDHKRYIGYEKPTPDLPHLLRHPDSYREVDSVSKAGGDLFYFGLRILDCGFFISGYFVLLFYLML